MKLFNLALDRIVDFHIRPDITYKENADFGEDYFNDVVGVTKHSRLKKEKIVLRADNSQANYILTKPIHSSQRIVNINEANNSMTFELEVVEEAKPAEEMMRIPGMKDELRRPMMLLVKANKK